MNINRFLLCIGSCIIGITLISGIYVEKTWAYPDKPIKVIVPYSAGGGTDTVARAIGKCIHFEKPFVVTNLAGAGGKLGTNEVVGSKPDGYTLLIHSVTAVVAGYYADLYDVPIWTKLAPVASMVSQSGGIIVRANSEWNTVEDLVAYAKQNPGKVTVGIPGFGGGSHIISAVFANVTGVDISYVPFKGAAETRAALAGGHVSMIAAFVSEVYDFIKAGELKMLASTGSKRSPKLPEVPTFKEKNIDFVLNHRNGVFAPQGTPKEIIAKLESALKDVSETDEFKQLMEKVLVESDFLSSEAFVKELEALDRTIKPIGHLIKAKK